MSLYREKKQGFWAFDVSFDERRCDIAGIASRFSHSRRYDKESGGARRDRTADLYNAIVALSQLSYGPVMVRSLIDYSIVCQYLSLRSFGSIDRKSVPFERRSAPPSPP